MMGIWNDLAFWQYALIALSLTHVTIASVTIFLHRAQAHRAVKLHPVLSHFFRFWLWLTTGTDTKEWVAVHRKHHAFCESEQDPHSPQIHGINKVLWGGVWLYRKEAVNADTLLNYGTGTPDDFLERHLYSRFTWLGITLMLLFNLWAFGWIAGPLIWLIQMLWIPFWAAGVINGIGHYLGYRRWHTPDASRNIVPWGILIGGEELHNNHHAFASSARLSSQWYEFDIGWAYIRLFSLLGLAQVKTLAPRIKFDAEKLKLDVETLAIMTAHRFQLMTHFRDMVMLPQLKSIRQQTRLGPLPNLRVLANCLPNNKLQEGLTDSLRDTLLMQNPRLATVVDFQQRLQVIWDRRSLSHEGRLEALEHWLKEAEATGIQALQQFAQKMPKFRLA